MEKTILPREEKISMLEATWGPDCFLCRKPFASRDEITIEHWYPQSVARREGWTEDEINDISNLRLAHKPCNAKKGDLIPVDDYTVPKREPKDPFKSRAVKRENRPTVCQVCDSGRKLGPGEFCVTCGSGPMPEVFPQWAKMKSTDCDHDLFWCWACSIGIVPREAAIIKVLNGGEVDP